MNLNVSGNISVNLASGLTKDQQIPGLLGGGNIGALIFNIPAGAAVNIHYNGEATGFPLTSGAAFKYDCGECRAVTFSCAAFAGTMIVQVWQYESAALGTSAA